MAGTTCWEYRKCGKEKEFPAHPNHGFNCWNLTGTVCRGEIQGTYDEKIGKCRALCPYYEGIMSGSIKIT